MIRFILLGLFVATSAYINEELLGQDGVGYYPMDGQINPEQYEMLRTLEELRRQEYERELAAQQEPGTIYEEELRIPGEKPRTNDSYLCTAFKQPAEKSIVSFEPLDSNHAAHHIILFVCEAPGIDRPVPAWDCGEMSNSQVESPYIKAPPCKLASAPIYAWSHGAGAERTQLPEGVGFPVGGSWKNQFIVLQVHYMNALESEDFSGVKISFTNEPQPKTAATLLLVTGGSIANQARENLEAACVIDEDVEMHPISFRVHTHRHGEKVSGWVVNEDQNGVDQWSLLGERSPQLPQIFESVKNSSMVIKQGDVLASRCSINNNENHRIDVGPTSEDEMCNFYLMYYAETPLSDNVCYSPGSPQYHWSSEAGLNHIPSN